MWPYKFDYRRDNNRVTSVYPVNGAAKPGQTVQQDHQIQQIVVTIKSQGVISLETIKRLLQQKYEVVDVGVGQTISVIR